MPNMIPAIPVAPPNTIDVRTVRLADRDPRWPSSSYTRTQADFAARYGFTLAAVRDWEQGRRKPGRTARILLELIRRDPAAVRAVLQPAEQSAA